jgi:hypothetical protein
MRRSRNGVASWTSTAQPSWGHTLETLNALDARWKQYEASDVDRYVSPVDDMLDTPDGKDYYFAVGRSALHIISEAICRVAAAG